MKMHYRLLATCAGIALCGLLAACDRHAAADDTSQSYEIITQTRPESIEGYYQTYRGGYQVCAAVREAMQLPPPPPLLQLPADFVTERVTYLASGGTYLTRQEEFLIDISDATAEPACSSRIRSSVTEVLVREGTIQIARRYPDGVLEVDKPEPLPPPPPSSLDAYSERRKLGGLALRCAPADRLLANVMPDMCVPDEAAYVPLDGQGRPIVVHARSTLLERANIVFLTEPVKVQIGQPVSSSRLALSRGN